MHVGFTGTRKGLQFPQLAALHTVLARLRAEGAEWLHHGDCLGGDRECHEMWREFLGLVHLHPPEDDFGRAHCDHDRAEPPLPFLRRNLAIARATSVLVAAPRRIAEEHRSGTWATVRYARQEGSRIILVLPSGVVREESATRQPTLV